MPLICLHSLCRLNHSKVVLQALLSIGRDRASLSIRTMPSYDEGAAILAHFDSDGVISGDEAKSFGIAVLSKANLVLDGTEIDFRNLVVSALDSALIASGEALIEINAGAVFESLDGMEHTMRFEIGDLEMAHDWFIQTYIFRDTFKDYTIQRAIRKDTRFGLKVEQSYW